MCWCKLYIFKLASNLFFRLLFLGNVRGWGFHDLIMRISCWRTSTVPPSADCCSIFSWWTLCLKPSTTISLPCPLVEGRSATHGSADDIDLLAANVYPRAPLNDRPVNGIMTDRLSLTREVKVINDPIWQRWVSQSGTHTDTHMHSEHATSLCHPIDSNLVLFYTVSLINWDLNSRRMMS